ncbi:presqualene diphosphate synthase HpnD [Commensalibacter papalotli (ex Servin-Garciduenas et al. 2014)]|uniref:Phytoene synthase n=1 Tax=Commensalibacter papalotli (ex Servin-Garciduenas et al. 2014) TaxID=1208583 RepID=W7DU18_9PROT|nr:presqualene diphosphate synthase HpnD [Commensalibacter papalotli (ex Servin-Garciduenas et al. 2014)]EUK17763.1 phytoene synthase [Commensalibacter papalotli (ex Servin-Garciduenas et al. 2014)]
MPKPLAEAAQIMGCSALDLTEVEKVVRKSKTSFATGMQILPPERRYGMYALYSFCRIVDDIADEDGDVPTKHRLLQEWRDRLDGLYAGQATDAVERVLLATIQRFNLKQQDFIDIINGMEMDVEHPIVAPDEQTFDLYCDRVASAVGRLAVRIFGDSSDAAQKVAYHLGRALQITNILRDIQEDAERGRLYLPKELLERFHLPLTPKECVNSVYVDHVCHILAYRALDHFRLSREFMAQCSPTALRPAKIMAITYKFLLAKQKKVGWKPPFKRVSLSLIEKIGVAGIGVIMSYIGLKR